MDVVRGLLVGSTYIESRSTEETSIPAESWRVRAGVGNVILEIVEFIEAAEEEKEDSRKLSLLTLVPPPLDSAYDRSEK